MDTPTKKQKSYKRELAFAMILGVSWVVWTGDIEMVKVIIWPVFAFAMGAFGLDSYAKQIQQNTSSYTTDGDPSSMQRPIEPPNGWTR